MNLAARAGRWSARHRKTAILGWLDRLGHRRRGSPDAPDAGIVYDMRVGVVGQIAAGAEVTDRGFAGEPRRIRDRAGRRRTR